MVRFSCTALASSLLLALLSLQPARALPSFAQQTGMECSGCHVGGFGPQLTPTGMKFKLGGYTDSNGQGTKIPLAAMLVEGFTHTEKKAASEPAQGFGLNNNFALQELSVFLAGGFGKHLGAFVQGTYSGIDDKIAMDNMDIRVVDSRTVGGHAVTYGLSFNNNPTVQDPFNSVPAWRFPYMSSDLANGPAAAPLLDGGLEMQVFGVTSYAFVDGLLVEGGAYFSPSAALVTGLGVTDSKDDVLRVKGGAPYWRIGYMKELGRQSFSVGSFGMLASVQPDRFAPATDDYTDVGFDANWQWKPTLHQLIAVNSTFLHEHRDLRASVGLGAADRRSGDLEQFRLTGSWYWRNTYGGTVSFFDTWGDRNAIYGSRTGRPDTRGVVLQTDWTPFGKSGAWLSPWANLRLALQYTIYDQFDGATGNYDGTGRDASDNNTLFCFLWTAF